MSALPAPSNAATIALYQPVLDNPAAYIAGGGEDTQIYLGALLELLLIIANVGTAVVVYPILRRQDEILSLGFVTARLDGVHVHRSRHHPRAWNSEPAPHSPDASALAVSLAALKDWTFLLGPGFIVGWGNELILGYLMYRSRLVPRGMAWLGLIGGPLIILSGIGTLFDAWDAGSTVPAITVIPEFVWELSLGIYAALWGFKRDSPILSGHDGSVPQTS